ncbi:hypothetical protein Tco_0504571 [Tanacetum coccineum]
MWYQEPRWLLDLGHKLSFSVLTKSGLVPINTARQSSSRAAIPVSTARPINTATPKPFVNVAKQRPNAFQKSHSLSRRPFYQHTTLKNRNLNNKVNTAKVNSVNTAKGKRVTSVVEKQGINVVKSSACWGDPLVSHRCVIGKNSVLFTDSECLILSPEFKLPDESQVMLKIPKKDNMYSFDLKNIVPTKEKKAT